MSRPEHSCSLKIDSICCPWEPASHTRDTHEEKVARFTDLSTSKLQHPRNHKDWMATCTWCDKQTVISWRTTVEWFFRINLQSLVLEKSVDSILFMLSYYCASLDALVRDSWYELLVLPRSEERPSVKVSKGYFLPLHYLVWSYACHFSNRRMYVYVMYLLGAKLSNFYALY